MANIQTMRLLFISNFYPPVYLGGKEIRCREVVEGLRQRGHECLVLTSDYAPPDVDIENRSHVLRILSLEADVYHYRPFEHLLRHPSRLRQNLEALSSAISSFQPDLVFVWGMWNLTPAIAAAAEARMPGRVVYSFGGYWPLEPDMHLQYWQMDTEGGLGRLFRRILAPLALSSRHRPVQADTLEFAHAITCSKFVLDELRRGGLAMPDARRIFSGIDVDQFVPAARRSNRDQDKIKVLYAGALSPRKNVHIVIEAMHLVREAPADLTIVGDGHPAYRSRLEDMVRQYGMENSVAFRESVPRQEMPQLLQQFDVLVVPSGSQVPEPLSRMVMEGMACGLVVIGTNAGGTPEMIEDGSDGLLFDPGDSRALADHLLALAADVDLGRRLGTAARCTAESRFDIRRMIREMESYLWNILKNSHS